MGGSRLSSFSLVRVSGFCGTFALYCNVETISKFALHIFGPVETRENFCGWADRCLQNQEGTRRDVT